MLVEFIGSSGSGKSTLSKAVMKNISGHIQTSLSDELVKKLINMDGVKHQSLSNLIYDIVGFPFFVWNLNKHATFTLFAFTSIAYYIKMTFSTINRFRAVVRKLGNYELFKRIDNEKIVLIDEGTIHTAHYIFVYSDKHIRSNDIARFAHLAPLPDAIIYVKASVEILLERTLKRNDSSRIIKSKSDEIIETYLTRSLLLFESLAENQKIRERMIVVENVSSAPSDIEISSKLISEFIIDMYNRRYEENSVN